MAMQRRTAKGGGKGNASANGAAGNAQAWAQKVAGLAGAWNARRGKVTSANFGPADVPDGKYIAVTVGAAAGVSKKGKGGPYFTSDFVIEGGEYKSEKVRNYQRLEDEEDTQRLINRLECMGYETATVDLRDLPNIAKQIVADKPRVRITVRNRFVENDDGNEVHYQDVFVDEPVGDDESMDGDGSDAPADGDSPKRPKRTATKKAGKKVTKRKPARSGK
jgi:hypothetical protein